MKRLPAPACWLLFGLLASGGCARPFSPPVPPAAESTSSVATAYDLIYAISHASPQPKPSPFLTSIAPPGNGGEALDIGAGAGRNSIYLARRGYRVTAVDLSHVGLDLLRQQAALQHLAITTVPADIHQFDFGQNRWNLICLIDFPFAYKDLLPKIAEGLRPGGLVVIQAVSIHEPGPRSSPDGSLHYTYMDRADLAIPFSGFAVLQDTDADEPTVWGVHAVMIRYAARKPSTGDHHLTIK